MDVVFVVMPFADVGRPAIGVSLLKADAIERGFSATILYENLRLADRIGVDLYQHVSSAFAPDILVGEWFFADDVFGDDIPPAEDYEANILVRFASAEIVNGLRAARAMRDEYLDEVVQHICHLHPRIVGFTTTFHQTCGSLAIARRLKALANPPIVVFGGANCEGEMGLQIIRSFDCIDYVCCGEADVTFPKLLEHLLRGGPAPSAGVLRRGARSVVPSDAVQDLNALPHPDYDDYFAQLDDTGLGRSTAYHVVVETSRGCWWGAKHHCTFCGLNGETMAFRSKTPTRAFDEIVGLCRKYGASRVGCVDNILDMHYLDTLFPLLAATDLKLELFYEVKANLRYDQLVKMHAGGVRQIQPGIESFSDQVLRLMDKGVTGFQNIQLMRWCEEIGIECAWNLLAGFPGESEAEYDRMAELVPLLTHLDPPCSCAEVRLDRFSPFHSRARQFGFRNLRPSRAYFFVFPLGRSEMSRLAYFFDFDYEDGRKPHTYLECVQHAMRPWWRSRSGSERPGLDAEFAGDDIVVTDTREVARQKQFRLSGVHARVFALADVAATVPALARHPDLAGRGSEVQDACDSLVADRLMARDGARYLTLAVFRNRPAHLAVHTSHADHNLALSAAPQSLLPLVRSA